MTEGLEIERKFLVELPKLSDIDVVDQLCIVQTYLCNGENGSQRRVRKITENGVESFNYTEKVFFNAVTRQENEYEISCGEYEKLLIQARPDCIPIKKKRVRFDWKDQLFELDIYPFSDKLAIMELELDSPEQEIFFPENVRLIKEVTGQEEYSNAALANAGHFPEEKDAGKGRADG